MCKGFFQTVHILDIQGFLRAVDFPGEARQDAARADFPNATAQGGDGYDGLIPALRGSKGALVLIRDAAKGA